MFISHRSRVVVAAVAIAALILGACATTPTDAQRSAFEKETKLVFEAWFDANLNADVEGYLAVWDVDFIKMASGKPTVASLEELRARKTNGFGKVVYEKVEVDIHETQLAGEFGWVQGTYVVVVRSKANGNVTHNEGTFLTVFKKQADGSWKVYRDTMMAAPQP